MNKNKYDEIMSTQDPVAENTRQVAEIVNKVITITLIVLYIIYIIGNALAKDLGDDQIASFFRMYNTVSVFISLAIISAIKSVILIFIELKCKSLDNTYRTSLLAKEIALSLADDNTSLNTFPDPATSSPITVDSSPEEIQKPGLKLVHDENSTDLIVCPQCGRKQSADRKRCFNCGCIFEK